MHSVLHFRETLEGSFSAVSPPLIAYVGAIFSVFEIYKICTLFHCSQLKKYTVGEVQRIFRQNRSVKRRICEIYTNMFDNYKNVLRTLVALTL